MILKTLLRRIIFPLSLYISATVVSVLATVQFGYRGYRRHAPFLCDTELIIHSRDLFSLQYLVNECERDNRFRLIGALVKFNFSGFKFMCTALYIKSFAPS